MTVTYKIIGAINYGGYFLDHRIQSCYEDWIDLDATTDAEAVAEANSLQAAHDEKARKVIEEAPEEDKHAIEASYVDAPYYTDYLWRCDDEADENVRIYSARLCDAIRLRDCILICCDPRVGDSVAVNSAAQLRERMLRCGWTDEDWESFINNKEDRPWIVHANLVKRIARDEAIYEAANGRCYLVRDNGEVSRLEEGEALALYFGEDDPL